MGLARRLRWDPRDPGQESATLLAFRVAGLLGVALICVAVPAVGEQRFLVAAILALLAAPIAIWLNLRFHVADSGWIEPMFDLLLVVTLIHLIPAVWFPALCVGLMVALAPSVGANPLSYRIYGVFALVLVLGLTLAAVVHDVNDWLLPMVTVVVIYPSVIFYSHGQAVRAAEYRERAQRLNSLNQVAGSVAHDFNNMLTAISGHAELAQLDLPNDHPAARSLDEVINGASRASLLRNQLLAFSGRKVQATQALDLPAELAIIVGLMEPAVPKGVSLALEACDEAVSIQGDRAELQQVIMNVILNAGEAFAEVPAKIDLRLRRQTVADERWVVLEVNDHGIGIAPNNLGRIFDPFFTSKERGHGLGLASAQRIMKAHGGSIVVHSQEGIGTHVELRFPELSEATVLVGAPVKPGDDQRGLILVVDDDAQIRDVARNYLQKLGFQVALAENSDTAVNVFFKRADDVVAVLLDLKMPGKDGWQCLSELRAVRTDVPVIICSGFDPVGLELSNIGPPLVFLGKPFRLADLRAALTDVRNGLAATREPSTA